MDGVGAAVVNRPVRQRGGMISMTTIRLGREVNESSWRGNLKEGVTSESGGGLREKEGLSTSKALKYKGLIVAYESALSNGKWWEE